MKATGIIRKIDGLGRVVLPVELRRALELEVRDSVEIYTQEDAIVLRKVQHNCIFCGSTKNVAPFRSKPVCAACREQLRHE